MDIVDADVLIDVQRGHPPALSWFSSLKELPSIPGFVVMELIQDERNAREARQAMKLAAPLTIIWSEETDCFCALSDFMTFHLSHGLGLIDSLIASCAIGRNATLNTFNAKHYKMIKRLSQNLMTPRRHDFRPQTRSDDESYHSDDTARRSDAVWGRKACRPSGGSEKARLRRCRTSTYHFADTLRFSALHPGFF
jgi:predicted nucleic acid-binding protein